MGRWTYLIPRSIIILLILLAIWLCRDPIIQRSMMEQAQKVTGAKVEIQQVRTSLANRKLFLKNIQVADPRNPMNNFVQAEMAYVDLDLQALAKRNFVIKDGRSSEVVFGAPRTTNGSLTGFPPPKRVLEVHSPPNFEAQVRNIGTSWVDQINPAPTISANSEMEVAKVGREIRDRWEASLVSHRADISQIDPAINRIQASLTSSTGLRNPLRNRDQEAEAKLELQRLDIEASGIQRSLRQLRTTFAREKEALMIAKTRDVQKLQQITGANQLDGEKITQLLLYERQGQLVDEAVQWLRWFRIAVLDPDQDLKPNNLRGVKVDFPGVTPQPDFLIEQIRLEGEGRFSKQHLNFAGTAYNLTTQPRLHPEPAIFELRAQGNQHVIVKCEIDRRTDQPIDRLSIQCPDLELDAEVLGHPDSLLVSMGPSSRVQAEIQIELIGDQLSGNLSFHHSSVSLHVDHLHPLAGGPDTALHINQNLTKTNKFNTNVRLSGCLDDYAFDFDSDLGSKFGTTVDQIVRDELEQKIRRQQARIDEIWKSEIEYLEQSVAIEIKQLASQLNNHVNLIGELKERIRTAESDQWTDIR